MPATAPRPSPIRRRPSQDGRSVQDRSAVDGSAVARIESELTTLFRRARSLARHAAAEIDPDLSPAAYVLLARLVDAGPMRASELVEVFGTDKAAISRQLSQLERLGLVIRETDPDDRRAQHISATADGLARARSARERSRFALRWQLEQWPVADVQALGELLAKLNEIDLES